MEKAQDEVFEALSLVKLKHRLRQKQASVKLPQMPLITIGEISIPNNLESQGLLCVGASKDRLNTSIGLIRQLKQRTDFRGGVASGWGSAKLTQATLQKIGYQTYDLPKLIVGAIDG